MSKDICYIALQKMKRITLLFCLTICLTVFTATSSLGQCSVCTKSAQQLGEKPAKALNSAIIYLMLTPFAVAGFIGYRWWKNNRQ